MEFAVSDLFSMGVGAVVTGLVARWYYMRAAHDLELETQKLRNLLRIALQTLEDAGMVRLNRDASGQIIGMVHELGGQVTAQSSLQAGHPKKDKLI